MGGGREVSSRKQTNLITGLGEAASEMVLNFVCGLGVGSDVSPQLLCGQCAVVVREWQPGPVKEAATTFV